MLQFLQIFFFLFPFYKYVYLYIFGVYVLFFFELPWLNISRFLKDRDGLMVLVGGRNGFSGFLIFPKNISVRLCFWRPCCPLEVYTEGQKARLWMDCGINFGLWVKEAHTESNQTGGAWNQLFGSFVLLPILAQHQDQNAGGRQFWRRVKSTDEREGYWGWTGSHVTSHRKPTSLPFNPSQNCQDFNAFCFSSFF